MILGAIKTAATGANPALALLQLLWRPLLILALVCGFYLWAHHRGAISQAAKDQTHIAQVQAQATAAATARDTAIAANATLAASEQALREANAKLASENARVAEEGRAAAQRIADRAAAADKAAATWKARYQAESAKAPCAAAKAELARSCAALKDY